MGQAESAITPNDTYTEVAKRLAADTEFVNAVKGAQGPVGPVGPAGLIGPAGPTGPAGSAGLPGAPFDSTKIKDNVMWCQDGVCTVPKNSGVLFDTSNILFKNGTGFGPYHAQFTSQRPMTCMDAENFTTKQSSECKATNAYQQFYLNPVSGQVMNAQTKKCLDAGSNPWNFVECNDAKNSQKFEYKDGKLETMFGNRCMDAEYSGNKDYNCNARASQNIVFRSL